MSPEAVSVTAEGVWPDDAEEIEEGVVANWFVREGGRVEEGETLGEIQVEKVSVDLPAPTAGRVEAILVRPNEPFGRGDPLVRIEPD